MSPFENIMTGCPSETTHRPHVGGTNPRREEAMANREVRSIDTSREVEDFATQVETPLSGDIDLDALQEQLEGRKFPGRQLISRVLCGQGMNTGPHGRSWSASTKPTAWSTVRRALKCKRRR